MKKKFITMLPVAAAVLFLSGLNVDASGNFKFSNSQSYTNAVSADFTQLVDTDKQTMYLTSEANILKDGTSVSSTIETDGKGTQVQLLSAEGELCKIITPSGKVGYVNVNKLTSSHEDIFNPVDEIKYADSDIEVKQLPQEESTTIFTKTTDDELHVVGTNDYAYYEVDFDGVKGYVLKDQVKDEKTPVPVVAAVDYSALFASMGSSGSLTKASGVNYYGGRRETYYSSNVLYHYLTPTWTLDSEGFYRDGDNYVVAASDMPQGTTFPCSKGTCIVLDTGCPAGTTDYYVAW